MTAMAVVSKFPGIGKKNLLKAGLSGLPVYSETKITG